MFGNMCVGPKKAREIWFLARFYTAQEAEKMGLINTFVPVKCQEVRRINNATVSLKESSITTEPNQGSDSTSYNSIEIRDAYLPPWIIEGVCEALKSNGSDFEASFVIEPMSVGLNIAIDMVCQKADDKVASDESLPEKRSSFGITNTIISPHLSRAFLKRLKYSDRSYKASLSPVFSCIGFWIP